ncbi:agamous-like MADS-box protein AGL80 [Senna tora]|uniref:Agamous-like MADS-box protein AGL80 n=1 Tax=Senna tora TaxID=362788 RepID=A0A834WF66_9FABA|nr:agamous-like MADS-box protein AGL80 [Senna tora]
MSREKAKFEYIADDQKRKLSFKQRERGIKKKAKELSVLCGVDAIAIAYNDLSDPHSEVWPDDGGVHGFLDKYHGMPILENTLNEEELIQKRLHKVQEYLKKKSNENFEEEISQLMINYMGGYADPTVVSENALHLKMLVEQHLKEIDRVMEESGKEEGEVFVPVAPPMSEEGSLMNRGNENGQTLHHHGGMGSGNWNSPSSCWNDLEDLEYYMGFGSSEIMPQHFQNANNQNNASSSNNPVELESKVELHGIRGILQFGSSMWSWNWNPRN